MTTNRLKRSAVSLDWKPPEQFCREANEKLTRKDVEWVCMDGKPVLRFVKSPIAMLREIEHDPRRDVMDRRGQPMTESDTFKLNKRLEQLGAIARYRSDGSRYLITEEKLA